MPTLQLRLWEDTHTNDAITKQKREPTWYYIHNLVLDVMLVMGENGDWDWAAHDTKNNTPHLFSNRKLAEQQSAYFKASTVKPYPWKR